MAPKNGASDTPRQYKVRTNLSGLRVRVAAKRSDERRAGRGDSESRSDGFLPDPAQDLPQHLVADPASTRPVTVVMTAAVAVAAPLNGPEQPLRLMQ